MADKTNIEWTDATWNIITGCTLVDDGCTNCYAAHLIASWPAIGNHPSRKGLARQNAAGVAKFTGEVRFNEAWLDQPLRWRKPRRIFVCAHGDLFHESVPDEWLDRVFKIMARCPQHTFQVLTKRPDRAKTYVSAFKAYLHPTSRVLVGDWHNRQVAAGPPEPSYFTRGGVAPNARETGSPLFHHGQWPLPNVWLGTSVSDQASADKRIPDLLATPAAVRFLSMEPLLGAVDLSSIVDAERDGLQLTFDALTGLASDSENIITGIFSQPDARIDWVIVGGESGPKARPMHPDWARSLRDQCNAAGVPFFFKQWGEFWPLKVNGHNDPRYPQDPPPSEHMDRVGKKRAGRLLDGREWNEMPGVRDG